MSTFQQLELLCKQENIEYICDAMMCDYTTFRIGGKADFLALPDSVRKLEALVNCSKECGIDYTVVGKGSNLLVADGGIRGLVIVTSHMDDIELLSDNTVVCSAGTPLIKLCIFALENSLGGLEFAYGIPGTVGGAAYMNAGAYGGEMKDVVVSCSHIDNDGKNGVFTAEELAFGYRKSIYEENGFIITGVTLKLFESTKEEIRAKMNDFLSRRKDKQPLEFPSAGSTFKRPEGYFAGALIEQCGLKGYSVGGAQVSEKHAGFVINKGGATAQDVLDLVENVKNTVLNETGVLLEPEIKFVG